MLRPVLALGSAAVLLATLTACGGSDATATDTSPAAATASQDAGAGGAAGGFTMPGASGTIAAISGKTLQVQSDQSGQVAVTYTADTAITAQVAGTLADVTVGSCVRIGSDDATDTSDSDAITATSVTITAAVDGSCSGGFGGGGGGTPPSGAPTDGMPSGMPTDLPSGMPTDGAGGGGFGGRGVSGEVSAVDGDTLTVEVSDMGATTTTPTAVTVSGTTTYTTTQDADSSALVVGQCATAMGDSDDTGAVTADTISVSDPVDGACTTGFGGGGGFGGGAPGQGGSGS